MNLGKENDKIEFKESLSELDGGIRALTSMLNAGKNAFVCFGVKDNGDVIGINYGEGIEKKIKDRIQVKVKPQIITNVNVFNVGDGKIYLKVSAEGNDIPYSFDGRYYVRNGARDEQVDPYMLRRILNANNKDMIVNKQSIFQDLTFKYLKSEFEESGFHIVSNEAMYKSYKFLTNDGKFNMTAFLLSDQNNIPIKTIRFQGRDKVIMLDKMEWSNQSLLKTFKDLMSYLKLYNISRVDFSQIIRKEIPLFNLDSLREAVVNAFVHNDWKNELPPSIYIFDDRMDIESYGELPYQLSLEDFYNGTSIPVNEGLFNIFMAKHISERSGHGIPTIVRNYGKEAIKLTSGMIRVSIKYNFTFTTPIDAETTPVDENTTPMTTPMETETTPIDENTTPIDENIIPITAPMDTETTPIDENTTPMTTPIDENTTPMTAPMETETTPIDENTTPMTTSMETETTPIMENSVFDEWDDDKKTQEKILYLIKLDKEISASEMANIIGITRDGIRYHLDIMKEKGIIKHNGTLKSGYWEIL